MDKQNGLYNSDKKEKQRLLNEQQVIERLDFITSFYLIIPLNYGKKKRNKNKIELVWLIRKTYLMNSLS